MKNEIIKIADDLRNGVIDTKTAETLLLGLFDVSKRFSVHTYSIINEDSPMYVHWSEGLKMIIMKDGVTLKLNSEEIEQLVKALPRTVSGSY